MTPGTQVGAYRVLHQIGEGGMGSVWLAEHAMLGRRAAIKVLHPSYTMQPDIVTRFFNEARAATSISDPGIVQIFDFGHHVDGSAYIVMELLEGETLDKRLARIGRFTVTDALRVMRQIASSLGAAHARGIVHRDLKPDNIFLVRDSEVAGGERAKIVDFGIAKLVGDASMKTLASAVLGTPTYMSPEQCRGAGQVDQRSDVYALGCMLFTLVVGRPPFDAIGIGDIISMHLREPPPAPSSRAAGIPPEIDHLVLRCMAKDPAQRFSSAADLAMAIGGLLGSSPNLAAALPGLGTGPFQLAPRTTLSAASSSVTSPPRAKSSRLPLIAGSLAVVGGGVAIILATRTSGGSEDSAAKAATAAPTVAMTPVVPPPPSTRDAVTPGMRDALSKFVTWSKDHPGAPCPDAASLGAPNDPWGHPLQITCTDQPGNQIVGAMSAGPDGNPGTMDDVASWQLGNDVTDIVRGTRWVVTPVAKTEPRQTKPAAVKIAKPASEPVAAPPPIAAVDPEPKVAEPAPPPAPVAAPKHVEPPRAIAPDVLKGLLVQSTSIEPPDVVRMQMTRDDKKKTAVVVKVCIAETGAVTQSSIAKSSGYPAYDEHAVSSVRGWRYKPYVVDNKAVPACSAVAVAFSLK
jgi:TonB family protein